MALDPRTPVLVGVGSCTRHPSDDQPTEAIELMDRALVAAGIDASPQLIERVGLVMIPNGTWGYPDPGKLLTQRRSMRGATTVLAEVGILQQNLLDMACARIADGQVDVVAVVGGEAKWRSLRADIAGDEAAETAQAPGTGPDELLVPSGEILTDCEIERDMAVPAVQYAMIDRALAHVEGLDHGAHVARLGRIWAAMAETAHSAPEAWDRSAPDATTITTASSQNKLVSPPYTKLLCSQWNVDQAAAVVVCSVDAAQRAGVPRDRWVFPWAGACSDTMVPLPMRPDLHRAPGVAAGAAAIRAWTGVDPATAPIRDIYSCFPAAVQVQCREAGIDLDDPHPLSVTGGMTFGGGPLNNYVLQAMVALARALRQDPGAVGLSTSVSGMLTKTGLGLWSATPPTKPFRALAVDPDAGAPPRPLDPSMTGRLTVVGSSVVCERGQPARAVVVAQDPGGVRTIAICPDASVAEAMVTQTRIGDAVTVSPAGVFTP